MAKTEEQKAEEARLKAEEKAKKEAEKKEIPAIDPKAFADLLEKVEKLTKDNAKLLSAADKGRLDKYEALHNAGSIVHTARMRFYDNKPVVGWKMEYQDVYLDTNGVLHEKQDIVLYYEDGTSEKMSYIQSERGAVKKEGEIIGRVKDSMKGTETVTLRLVDGSEHLLDIRFIN